MADEMPSNITQVLKERPVFLPLLYPIFSEVAYPGFVGEPHGLVRLIFRDGDECNFLGIAANLLGGAGDTGVDALKIGFDRVLCGHGGAILACRSGVTLPSPIAGFAGNTRSG